MTVVVHLGMPGSIPQRECRTQKPHQCQHARTAGSGGPQPAGWSSAAAYRTADTRAAMTAESTAVCDQQTAEGAGRADLPGLRQRRRRCVRPRIPGFSPGGLGPHLTSSGFPRRAFLRFPVCPPGSPSPAFLWFPFVRRLRFVPFGRCPVPVPLRCPSGSLPLSNLHDSAAAGRFRRRWSRTARAKVTSPAATPAWISP